MSNIKTAYVFQGDVTEPEKETITKTVQFNLDNKMSEYIHAIEKKKDTEIHLKITIGKNKKRLFDGSFVLAASGTEPLRYEREDFSELTDLVNHAFDRFKETLASK